jgi:hypothetical protein
MIPGLRRDRCGNCLTAHESAESGHAAKLIKPAPIHIRSCSFSLSLIRNEAARLGGLMGCVLKQMEQSI